MTSSFHISHINFNTATTYGIKISVVAELRRKLKKLLFELDQSSPLLEPDAKKLIIEVLSQEETTNAKQNTVQTQRIRSDFMVEDKLRRPESED